MAPKPKRLQETEKIKSPSKSSGMTSLAKRVFAGREGLGEYLESPESNPRVVYHNELFVVIRDLFPKSTVHLLILPRDPAVFFVHPFEALVEPELLAKVKVEVERTKRIAAEELKRQFGNKSASSKAYNNALEASLDSDEEVDLSKLPAARDWTRDIKVGVHTNPSMAHLHIHVLSKDMHSPALKHRKHYNSFVGEFFTPIEDLPLRPEERQLDAWRKSGAKGWDEKDMLCWRCGRNFGNKFKALKEHLEKEWEEWKKE